MKFSCLLTKGSIFLAKSAVNLQGKIEGVSLRGKVYCQSLGQSLLLIFREKSTVNLRGKVYGQSLGSTLSPAQRNLYSQSVGQSPQSKKQQPWSLFKAKSTIYFQGKVHGQSGQSPRSKLFLAALSKA